MKRSAVASRKKEIFPLASGRASCFSVVRRCSHNMILQKGRLHAPAHLRKTPAAAACRHSVPDLRQRPGRGGFPPDPRPGRERRQPAGYGAGRTAASPRAQKRQRRAAGAPAGSAAGAGRFRSARGRCGRNRRRRHERRHSPRRADGTGLAEREHAFRPAGAAHLGRLRHAQPGTHGAVRAGRRLRPRA